MTHRPPSCLAIGLKIDSDIGVGKNWSLEFAAKSLKLARNLLESSCDLSASMLSGSKNRWMPVEEAIDSKLCTGEMQKRRYQGILMIYSGERKNETPVIKNHSRL